MKQTAVEFLEEQIRYYISNDDRLYDMFKQAKAMEKEQIMDALRTSEVELLSWGILAEQYYNETYEQSKQG